MELHTYSNPIKSGDLRINLLNSICHPRAGNEVHQTQHSPSGHSPVPAKTDLNWSMVLPPAAASSTTAPRDLLGALYSNLIKIIIFSSINYKIG